jgi:hypothetical protein
VYRSTDRGRSWTRIAHLCGQVWSNLFLHGGSLYIMGTDHRNVGDGRINGRVVIRRSDDGGVSWTTPADETSGLLAANDGWHTAPVPIVVHRGRIWRGFEFAPSPERVTWRPLVVSAPVEADLLRRDSWKFSEQLEHDAAGDLRFIEGNVVVAPGGSIVDVVRVNRGGSHAARLADRAILVHVGEDGVSIAHDPHGDMIDFPGGGSKFTIRFDPQTGRYWALVNGQWERGVWRNVLHLASSEDLRHWTVHAELLRHPDAELHAFQYVDWVFEGQDILYVSRTSFDDGTVRPRPAGRTGRHYDAHDANYFTFHRLEGFRSFVDRRL